MTAVTKWLNPIEGETEEVSLLGSFYVLILSFFEKILLLNIIYDVTYFVLDWNPHSFAENFIPT